MSVGVRNLIKRREAFRRYYSETRCFRASYQNRASWSENPRRRKIVKSYSSPRDEQRPNPINVVHVGQWRRFAWNIGGFGAQNPKSVGRRSKVVFVST